VALNHPFPRPYQKSVPLPLMASVQPIGRSFQASWSGRPIGFPFHASARHSGRHDCRNSSIAELGNACRSELGRIRSSRARLGLCCLRSLSLSISGSLVRLGVSWSADLLLALSSRTLSRVGAVRALWELGSHEWLQTRGRAGLASLLHILAGDPALFMRFLFRNSISP